MDNNIDFTLPEAVATEAGEALNHALTLLKPYLIALSPAERQAIPNMSDKTLPFVEKTIAYCDSNPQFVPPFMRTDVLKSNMLLYKQLIPLLRVVKQLNNGLDDTSMKAGAGCYTNSLNYYNTAKQADRNDIPGAKGVVEDLRKRFVKNRNEELEPDS